MKHKATMADNKSEKNFHTKFFFCLCANMIDISTIWAFLNNKVFHCFFFVLLLLVGILLVVLQDSRHNLDRLYSVYSQKKVRLQWTNITEHKGFRFWSHLNQRCYENDGWKSMQLPLCSLIKLHLVFIFFIRNYFMHLPSHLENSSWRSLSEGYFYSD